MCSYTALTLWVLLSPELEKRLIHFSHGRKLAHAESSERQGAGVARVPGSAGEFMWAGYAGTYFWVDPKEELVAVYMSQAPSTARAYYRKLVKQLVYAAIVN
jgi:CubicO group peptidase (beta-lactamase class C family)